MKNKKQIFWAVKEMGGIMVNGYGFPALYETGAGALRDGFKRSEIVRVKIVEI